MFKTSAIFARKQWRAACDVPKPAHSGRESRRSRQESNGLGRRQTYTQHRGVARRARLHTLSLAAAPPLPSHDSPRGVSFPFLRVHPPRELENLAAKSMARRDHDDDDEIEEEDEEEAYDLDEEEEEDEEDDYEEEARRGKASRGGGGGKGGGSGRKRSREDNFIDDSAIEDDDEEDDDDDGGGRPRKKGGGGVRGFFDEEAQVDEDEEEEDEGEGEDGEWSPYFVASRCSVYMT